MASLLTGFVILGLGAVFVWRSRAVQTRQARQYRDAGVVIAVAGAIIVLASLVVLAKGGF